MKIDTLDELKGTAIKNIVSVKELKKMNFPLPPLNEQHRIVAKVDQLMTFCDKLEEQKEKRDKKLTSLNKAFLDKLLSAREPDEFQEHWQRIVDNFDLLYNKPQNVSKLKQAILQLAIQGKLVKQAPNDEPASELLKRIKAEKENLIVEGNLKKEKPLPPITENKIPYEIPNGWEWARLGDISLNIHYGYTASANYSIKILRLLRISDIQNNRVDWNSVPGCQIASTEVKKYELMESDILIARTGGTIGKSFIVNKIPVKAVFASYLIRIIP